MERKDRILVIEPDVNLLNCLMRDIKGVELVPFSESRGDSVFDYHYLMDILCNRPYRYHIIFDQVGHLTDTSLTPSNQSLPEATAMKEILWKTIALIQTCYAANLEVMDKPVRGITIMSSADLYWFDGTKFRPYPPDEVLVSTRLYLLRAIKQMEVMVHRFYSMSQYPGKEPQISIIRAGERTMIGAENTIPSQNIEWPYGYRTNYQALSNHISFFVTNDVASFTLSHVATLNPKSPAIVDSIDIGYPEQEFDELTRIDK